MSQQEPYIEPKPAHYVDNEKFYSALVEYRNEIDHAKANDLPKPRISNYIGECFLKIATHLSYKANFINYTFKDDMISDGIENCITAVEKFDPERGKNPFAYYTTVTYWAFVRRILKEKKVQAIKYKMMENIDIDQIISHADGDEEFITQMMDMVHKRLDTVDPERRVVGKRGRKPKAKVEKVLEINLS